MVYFLDNIWAPIVEIMQGNRALGLNLSVNLIENLIDGAKSDLEKQAVGS